jgi:hypothetical protein
MKLYHHFSRFQFLRSRPKEHFPRIRWALTLKPGDLINDCSGFNRIVREIYPEKQFNKHGGWAIYDVNFITEPHGGGCSLVSCGVTKPISREELERVWFINHDPTREFWPHRLKQMATWYGSLEHEDAKVEIAKIRTKLSVLSSGGHFLDPRGILLPEYD